MIDGLITTDTFKSSLRQFGQKSDLSDIDIQNAWNAMLIGWDTEKFTFLTNLKKKYRVFLLSNTNEMHIEWVIRDLDVNHQISDFETRFFNKVYYSHKINMRKPDVDIYKFLIADSNLNPAESIFIDDLIENIDGAKKSGLNTYHHNPNDNLIKVFREELSL